MAATRAGVLRDKYGVMTMAVGDSKYIKDADAKMFQTSIAMRRRTHPELRAMVFRTESAFNGIIVERVK